METFDVIVIGSGPGGYIAAQKAGELGKKVLLVEKGELGGVCTNVGCIPTKSLLNSAKLYKGALDSEKFGVKATNVEYDLAAAMAHKNDTIETLKKGIAFLMKNAKVEVVQGAAHFIDETQIEVEGKRYGAKNFIIATGSSPQQVPISGSDLPHVLTSNEILAIDKLPSSLAIVGGGVIGIEFASYFSAVGVKVTVFEMMDEVLPMMDPEFAKLIRREMRGVDFFVSAKVTSITADSVVFTDAKGNEKTVAAEMVLMSVGRKPNTEGLEALKLQMDRSAVAVDENLRTSIPHIYAIGDVNGKSLLAHSASRMAEVVIANLYTDKSQKMRYHAIPWALYSSPEAAGCGLTELQAAKEGRPVISATAQMRPNGRFLAEQGKRASGLCKVVADAKTRAILGVHLLGPYSSEIIYGAAAMIEAELRIEDVKEIVFPHPSIAEIIKDTLFALEQTQS
ncbi:MAG: dihydrolipoyl dehydrogenase [Sphaerochaetaceae bacterium]